MSESTPNPASDTSPASSDAPLGEVEVLEYWYRDPRNPYGWYDHWLEVPEHGIRYGLCYPMVVA